MEKKETDTKNKNRNTKENQIEDQEIDWGEIDKMAKLVAKNLMGPTREEILKRKNRSAMGNHVCNCPIEPPRSARMMSLPCSSGMN
ncbi:MAG: hypothetical protein OXI87_18910 [Albidovulum sp.]|nr:hypothetical protein [Albidovulum sp.]